MAFSDCELRYYLYELFYLLTTANSTLNPFVCTLRLRPFREAIGFVLKKLKPRDNENESSGNDIQNLQIQRERSNTAQTVLGVQIV